jgi:hypothetical protein
LHSKSAGDTSQCRADHEAGQQGEADNGSQGHSLFNREMATTMTEARPTVPPAAAFIIYAQELVAILSSSEA